MPCANYKVAASLWSCLGSYFNLTHALYGYNMASIQKNVLVKAPDQLLSLLVRPCRD